MFSDKVKNRVMSYVSLVYLLLNKKNQVNIPHAFNLIIFARFSTCSFGDEVRIYTEIFLSYAKLGDSFCS